MREEERITRILDKIKKLWQNSPDQRFGQLCINHGIMKDDFVTWSLEDEDWEGIIDKQLAKEKQNDRPQRRKN